MMMINVLQTFTTTGRRTAKFYSLRQRESQGIGREDVNQIPVVTTGEPCGDHLMRTCGHILRVLQTRAELDV